MNAAIAVLAATLVDPAAAQATSPARSTQAVQSAQSAPTIPKTRPAATPRPAALAGQGFTIAPAPAWVQPLAWDAAAPIAPAALQVLVADEQLRVQPGGNVDFRHFLRQVNDTSGLQAGGQIEIEFDPVNQKLILHKLDIVRGGQRIDKLDPRNVKLLHRETQLERQMVDGRMTASIVLDDLRVGDRVEWEASIVGENPVFGGRFVDTVWSQLPNSPIGQWQFRLLAPVARDIHHRAMDSTIDVASSVHDGLRDTTFRRRNAPQFRPDARLPFSDYLKPQVDFSEFADWQDVAGWAQQLFVRAMQPNAALDAEVADLKAKAATPDAQLRAALDFVQRDIRYFGTEIGPDSHQPADAETVLRHRFGDCKDKVALLAALLARLGFDAQPVLVSAHFRSATSLRLPSPLAFDHAIVRVVVDGKPVWLDATRSQQTGTVAARQSIDLGSGLVASSATTALTELPNGRDTLRAETTDTFSFPKLSQEGTLTSVTILHGDVAEWFRGAIAALPRAEADKLALGEVQRAYPSLVPVGEPQFETVTEDDTVKLTSHFRTGDFWSFPDQRGLVSRYTLYTLVGPLRIPDDAARAQPFRNAAPGRYRQKTVFEFGEEAPVASNTMPFDENNPNFELHLQFEIQPRHQEASGELHQLGDVVAAADWAAYRDQIRKVAPRLVGQIGVLPLTAANNQALRSETAALNEAIRKGQSGATTPLQANAKLRLLMLDRELDSDRLPPKLRAQALYVKGMQLDYLARWQDARDPLVQSIALDPAVADVHQALAVNAFFLRQDAEALREVDTTLKLSPSATQARFTRAWTQFFNGDMTAARAGFVETLQQRQEIEHGYGAIWLYLATQRLGGDAAAAVAPYLPTASAPEWPYPVLQSLLGKLTPEAALAASQENGQRNPGRECELYFYLGEKAVGDNDLDKARTLLKKAVDAHATEFNEYAMARRELERLQGK